MLLDNWKKFLTNKGFLENESQISILDNLTDYFTFVNAINLSEASLLTNLTGNTITEEYVTFLSSLKNLGSDINLLNSYYIENNNLFFNNVNIQEHTMNFINTDFFNKLTNLTFIKNDSIKIINFFPGENVQDTLSFLDIWFYDRDNECYNNYESSVPDTKLYYPEPFIASPSFVHEEIWFIHILHYNYWLWFFFISLIMFYFITFINVVRWCNLRAKPKRETRGVSRSKCADLITACVPVSWAISIIISETVDATDYYDGFSTGEIVLGIRAYQWGWEYFYPKNIDLNYNVKSSYSTLIGNSIKYNNSNSSTIDTNQLWNFYQKKNLGNFSNLTSNLIFAPTDSNLTNSNIDFSHAGNSISKDSNAFKKIQKFSKVSLNNLTRDTNNNLLTLRKVNNLYLTKNSVVSNAYNYGNSNQNAFSSVGSVLPMSTTLLDSSGLNKYLDYSLNFKSVEFQKESNNNFTFNKDEKFDGNITNSMYSNHFLSKKLFLSRNIQQVDDSFSNKDKLTNLNVFNKSSLGNKSITTSNNILDEFICENNNTYYSWNVFNNSKNYTVKDLTSANLRFLSIDKNPRLLTNTKTNVNDVNFNYKTGLTLLKGNLEKLDTNVFSIYNDATNYWNSNHTIDLNLKSNRTSNSNLSPIYSNNSLVKISDFDRVLPNSNEEVTKMLKSKEESAPSFVFDTYWHSFYNNMNLLHNYHNVYSNFIKSQEVILPNVSEHSEYDFRNWQSLESLEDAIWESSYPSFLGEEYFNLKKSLSVKDFNNLQDLINQKQRVIKFKYRFLPYSNSNITNFNEELFYDFSTTSKKDLDFYSNSLNVEAIEDSYEFLKNLNSLTHSFYKNNLILTPNFIMPNSYSNVFNAFRADFSEANWLHDNSLNNKYLNHVISYNTFNQSNNIKLRTTAKNSIVTYNAIQKVYKSRFDDARSNVNFKSFSNSYNSVPFITEARPSYEQTLGKNKDSFYNSMLFNSFFKNNYSTLVEILNTNNYIFADLPFLISMKSDASRYLWFDWHSRWSSIEVQPSSIAKYSLAGLPYFSKTFEYSTSLGDELNDSENYLTKISRARKNSMPNWSYSPYFFQKLTNWFNYSNYFVLFDNTNIKSVKLLLTYSKSYWNDYTLLNNTKYTSSPTFSGLNRNNVVTWSPINNKLASYYYNTSILLDILTKREHLYRRFFKEKSNVTMIPDFLTVSPNNSLFNEIKSSYMFIDPTTYGSEVTRELLYNNSEFLHYTFLRDFIKTINNLNYNLPINFNLLNNYFVYLLGKNNGSHQIGNNNELFKSQYRPMKKGIVNMIRLQATSAIAMPTEIRLHILASSKDVIHSWAIPSAGIKIDCVPGYSSHRVAIFLAHGIFWGQCMEICGRYHHWMPIIVYFMKRDLFFLWCTHFIHYVDLDNTFNTTDKQLTNYLRLVSFDKGNWVNEINKFLS